MATPSTLLTYILALSLTDLTAAARSHPIRTVLLALLPVLFPAVRANYNQWRALGTNGIQQNVLFWLVATALKPLERETTSMGMYARVPDQSAWLDEPLPTREGARPRTGWHALPNRQTDQFPDDAARETMVRAFKAYPKARPYAVDVARSPHERLHDAYVLRRTCPRRTKS